MTVRSGTYLASNPLSLVVAFPGIYMATGGNGITAAPTIVNVLPAAFDVSFSTARLEPLTFDINGIPGGCAIAIAVKLANRDETLTALDFNAAWCWPFDVQPDNSIGSLATQPVHVTLLPRNGWPPGTHTIQVMAGAKATHTP